MVDGTMVTLPPSAAMNSNEQNYIDIDELKQGITECFKGTSMDETDSSKAIDAMSSFCGDDALGWLQVKLTADDFVKKQFNLLTSQRIIDALKDFKENISRASLAANESISAEKSDDVSLMPLYNVQGIDLAQLQGDNDSKGSDSKWNSYHSFKKSYQHLQSLTKCQLHLQTGGTLLQVKGEDPNVRAPSMVTITCRTGKDCPFTMGFKLNGTCTSHTVSVRDDCKTYKQCLFHNHAFTAITTTDDGTEFVASKNYLTFDEKEFIKVHAEQPNPIIISHLKAQMEARFNGRKYDRRILDVVAHDYQTQLYGRDLRGDDMNKFISEAQEMRALGGVFKHTLDDHYALKDYVWAHHTMGPYANIYGDFVLLDGTHWTNKYGLNLMTPLVVDCLMKTTAAGWIVAGSENSDSVCSAFTELGFKANPGDVLMTDEVSKLKCKLH